MGSTAKKIVDDPLKAIGETAANWSTGGLYEAGKKGKEVKDEMDALKDAQNNAVATQAEEIEQDEEENEEQDARREARRQSRLSMNKTGSLGLNNAAKVGRNKLLGN